MNTILKDRIEDAPLGLEEEFPQFVWLTFTDDGSNTTYRRDGETFVTCYRSEEDGQAALLLHPVVNRRRRWFWQPRTYAVRFEEWPLGEAETWVRERVERRDQHGRYIRGLALFDAQDRYLMKRYVR